MQRPDVSMPISTSPNSEGDARGEELLIEAVNALVVHRDAQQMFDSMVAITNLAKVHPIGLTGSAAVLNPLLRLRIDDHETYERVMELVESKRAKAELPPLIRPVDDRYDKTEYMRGFMDAKRQRQRLAADIENMLRAEPDRLIGRSRIDFMDAQSAKWKAALDAKLEEARNMRGGRLPKPVLDTIRQKFWDDVDAKLEEMEAWARKEQMKPPHLRKRSPE